MAKDVIYPGPSVPPEARDQESVHHEAGVTLRPGRITIHDDAWADKLLEGGLVAPISTRVETEASAVVPAILAVSDPTPPKEKSGRGRTETPRPTEE